MAISKIDWARLAAYIDGEGCISIGMTHMTPGRPPILFLEVQVANTDLRLVEWIRSRFGGIVMVTTNRKEKRWAQAFRWYIASRKAADILRSCLPFFVIKREQAEVALAFQSNIKRWGVKGRPRAIVELQFQRREQLQLLKGTSSRAPKLRQENLVLPVQ